ncbi:MAG: hypothetical protein RIB93_19790 [Coleofasciculus sp. D1-CHI-01]
MAEKFVEASPSDARSAKSGYAIGRLPYFPTSTWVMMLAAIGIPAFSGDN